MTLVLVTLPMTSVFPAVSGFISGLPLAPLILALSPVVTYYDIWLLMAQQLLVPDFRNFSSMPALGW